MQVIVALTQLIGFRKEADGVHNRRFTLMQLEIPYIRDNRVFIIILHIIQLCILNSKIFVTQRKTYQKSQICLICN